MARENWLNGSHGPAYRRLSKCVASTPMRFDASLEARARSGPERDARTPVPMHPGSQALIEAAVALAATRRRSQATGLHLLYILTGVAGGTVGHLLTQFGSSTEALLAELEKWV